jgi:O-antigen/teichoic acid export membrane protein
VAALVAAVRRVLDRDDGLLKHSAILLVAGTSGHVVNYVYQLVMGRMLGPEQYGSFGALMALAYILSVPVQAIQATTVRRVASLDAERRWAGAGAIARRTLLRVGVFGLIALAVLASLGPLIASFLRIGSAAPVLILSGALYLLLLGPALGGTLMGLQRFLKLGVMQIAGACGKLAFSVGLVALGAGLNGAVAGLTMGAWVCLLLGGWFLRDALAAKGQIAVLPRARTDFAIALASYVGLTLLYTIDTLVVKRVFDPSSAGSYVAVSTLSRSIFFGSSAIAGAMLPKAATRAADGDSQGVARLLRRALVYTVLLATAGALLLNACRGDLVTLVFGNTYMENTRVLRILSIGMCLLSLCNVMVLFGIAKRQRHVPAIVVGGALVEAVALVAFHQTIGTVAMVFTATMGVSFLTLALLALRSKAGSRGDWG